MLIKLNKDESCTVMANHSEESNAFTITNFGGTTVQAREFGPLPSSNNDYEKCHALACKIVNEYDFDTSEELLAGFIQRHFA
jgi:hypothetical protein